MFSGWATSAPHTSWRLACIQGWTILAYGQWAYRMLTFRIHVLCFTINFEISALFTLTTLACIAFIASPNFKFCIVIQFISGKDCRISVRGKYIIESKADTLRNKFAKVTGIEGWGEVGNETSHCLPMRKRQIGRRYQMRISWHQNRWSIWEAHWKGGRKF